LDEACIPLRNRHREPRADERALAGSKLHALAGGKIQAGVAVVRACRDNGVCA